MIKISAVILTRGDRDLNQLVKSLSFCDETVVLKNDNLKDFAKQRNIGLAKAKNDWVLFVDDDETVPKSLASQILSAIRYQRSWPSSAYPLSPVRGFYIKRRILFLGKEVGEDRVLRLGKKSAGKWYRRVHEIWRLKGRMGTLQNYLLHNTAESLSEMIAKLNSFSTLHAGANLVEGKKSNLLKLTLFPLTKLSQNLLLGRGFVFSLLMSFHSFLAWSKLWMLQRKSD